MRKWGMRLSPIIIFLLSLLLPLYAYGEGADKIHVEPVTIERGHEDENRKEDEDEGEYEKTGEYEEAGEYEEIGEYEEAGEYEKTGEYEEAGEYEKAGEYSSGGENGRVEIDKNESKQEVEGKGKSESETLESTQNQLLENMDFDLMNQQIKELMPGQKESFSSLVMKIMHGETKLNAELIKKILKNATLGNVDDVKKIGVSLISLGVMASLFSGFGHLFKNHQILDISFYFIYMLFMLLLLVTFKSAMDIAKSLLENMILFLKLLIPTFFAAIGATSAMMTAVVFNQFMLLIILLVELLLSAVLLPMTSVYIFLSLINGLGDEDRFSALIDLLHRGIEGSLKVTIAGVSGIGFFQSMITPVIDNVRTMTVQKTIAAIPGIGRIADSLSEVVLGSTILIKNSVGIAFVILLLGLCAVPLIRILLLGAVIKISAAFMGIITDRRMTNCANQVGNGTFLILRIVATAVAMIIITIAIIISATNHSI
ncbi:MAG: stage III sporulation protein AE [Lachnospiraceae bacterium]|nr:stage III sporulation protein AE [Lachnospiraceae bacterium]